MLLEGCITDPLRIKRALKHRKAPAPYEIGAAQNSRIERVPKVSILCPNLISLINPAIASTRTLRGLPEIIKLWNHSLYSTSLPVGIFQH